MAEFITLQMIKISKTRLDFNKLDVALGVFTSVIFKDGDTIIDTTKKLYQFLLTNKNSNQIYFRQKPDGQCDKIG